MPRGRAPAAKRFGFGDGDPDRIIIKARLVAGVVQPFESVVAVRPRASAVRLLVGEGAGFRFHPTRDGSPERS